jgi:hypothetical protein
MWEGTKGRTESYGVFHGCRIVGASRVLFLPPLRGNIQLVLTLIPTPSFLRYQFILLSPRCPLVPPRFFFVLVLLLSPAKISLFPFGETL